MPEDTTNANAPIVDASATAPVEETVPVMDAPAEEMPVAPVEEGMPAAPVAPEATPETPAANPAM